MVVVIAFFVALYSGLALAGWAHQNAKSPEQKHLEWLIDTCDPMAVQYAQLHFAADVVTLGHDGLPYLLI